MLVLCKLVFYESVYFLRAQLFGQRYFLSFVGLINPIMYKIFKAVARLLISKKLLFRLEPLFRRVVLIFYLGNRNKCNLCNTPLRKFVSLGDGDYICPACGSLPRTRRVWDLINTKYVLSGAAVLDFSPSRSLYRAMKRKEGISYFGSDISGDFLSDFSFDITNIDCEDETFDVIICYHILEHIVRDDIAIKELYRVLKKGGKCLIQTPFKDGDTYENSEIQTEKDRKTHFGQEDHVRVYSVSGLSDRLLACGFRVEPLNFIEEKNNFYGFSPKETVLICIKK
jgi:SAM-dependent methyltransferase